MKIVIIGLGTIGKTILKSLSDKGHNITIIDEDKNKIESLIQRYDVSGVVGNGATHTTLLEAGIKSADLFIAVTNSDELNLLCCMVAKKEGDCQTIARVKSPEYSDEAAYLEKELGLAMVINPEYAAAEEIARVLRFPAAIKIEPFAQGKVELIKFRLPSDSVIVGMSVKEVMMKYRCEVLVCTIERGEDAYIANGDFVFAEKDVITIVAAPIKAKEFFSYINYTGQSIKNAIVVGGGVITHYLGEIMGKSGISLKIIERNLGVCEELAADFPKYHIIHGNAADKDLLLEEGVARVGAFVALSAIDEENILHSLFVKDVCRGKLITKINRSDYDSVINKLDLDTVICPINITSDTILRYVRANRNKRGSNVETLYNIIQDKVEASEFLIKEKSPIAGKPLSKLKFKEDVLIASIYRDETVIIPRGNDIIQAGDRVVIVSKLIGLEDVKEILR